MRCSVRDQEGEYQCELTQGPAQGRRKGTKAGLVILSEKLRGVLCRVSGEARVTVLSLQLRGQRDSKLGLWGELRCATVISNVEYILNLQIWLQEGLMRAQNPQQRCSKVIHTNRFPVIDFGTCPVHSPVHFQSNYKQSGRRVNQFIQSHLNCDKPASVA